jgi:hypothetical protein
MRTPRGTFATVALALALAGCNSADGTPTAPATAADPKAALTAATAELKKGTFTYALTGHEERTTGSVHLPSRSAEMRSETASDGAKASISIRLVEPDRYMKMTMDLSFLDEQDSAGGSPEMAAFAKQLREVMSGRKWMHLDLSKMDPEKAAEISLDEPDISGASTALANAVTVTSTGATTFAGTIDYTKVPSAQVPWGTGEGKAAAAKLAAVPFTAALDAQGRLAKLEVDLPAIGEAPAHKRTTEITGYGTAVAVKRPAAGETVKAPDSAYEAING